MADRFPEIKVDADRVIAKFGALPERLRSALRRAIPPVTRKLADLVRAKLQPGALGTSARTGLPLFRTSDRLLPAVSARMTESAGAIAGRVFIDPGRFPAIASMSLEYGARPHEIVARSASALYFFWDRLGKNVALQKVNHPGFPGAAFMRTSLREMRPEIRSALTAAAAQEVRA